jgi:hypothetical protein
MSRRSRRKHHRAIHELVNGKHIEACGAQGADDRKVATFISEET